MEYKHKTMWENNNEILCHKNENNIQIISTTVNGRQIVKIKNRMIQGQFYNSWSTLTDVRQDVTMKEKTNILPTLLFHNSEQCISQFIELKEKNNIFI